MSAIVQLARRKPEDEFSAKAHAVLSQRHVHPILRAGAKAGVAMFLFGLLSSALQSAATAKSHRKAAAAVRRAAEAA